MNYLKSPQPGSNPSGSSDPKTWLILPAALILQLFVLLLIHYRGIIDGDEGFYVMISTLVAQGKQPYRDFCFHQMPLLPYLYAGWMNLFGFSWEGARSLSWVLVLLMTAILFRYFREKGANRGLLILMMGLFITNGLAMGWLGLVKTQASSTFFTLLSLLCLTESLSGKGGRLGFFLGGIALGIAGSIRLFFLPLVAPMLLWMILAHKDERWNRLILAAALFLLGWILGCLPGFYFFFLDAKRFYWNNLAFHLGRYPVPMAEVLFQKILTLAKLFASPQFWVMGILFALASARLLKTRSLGQNMGEWGAWAISVSLFLLSVAPSPVYLQYFSVLFPFMAITFFPALKDLWYAPEKKKRNLAKILVLIYFLSAFPTWMVHGIARPHREDPKSWSLKSVKEAGDYLRLHSQPQDAVFATWPGYIFSARRDPVPGMETHFGYYVSFKMSPEERRYYRLPSQEDILLAIDQKTYTLAVIGGFTGWPGLNWEKVSQEIENRLVQNGYWIGKQIGQIMIYQRK
jgi:4-amino-4-deoxy-L-arabinose transferase-like glycosyltransferase